MTTSDYIIEVLGGRTVFRDDAPNPSALRQMIKRGLPYRSLDAVRRRFQLSLPETAVLLHLPVRTLARRKLEQRLQADESDRLYRLARVGAQAAMVLGTDEKAAAWLRRPNRALNNESPLRLLDTDVGARQVEDILGRIEFGIVG